MKAIKLIAKRKGQYKGELIEEGAGFLYSGKLEAKPHWAAEPAEFKTKVADVPFHVQFAVSKRNDSKTAEKNPVIINDRQD